MRIKKTMKAFGLLCCLVAIVCGDDRSSSELQQSVLTLEARLVQMEADQQVKAEKQQIKDALQSDQLAALTDIVEKQQMRLTQLEAERKSEIL